MANESVSGAQPLAPWQQRAVHQVKSAWQAGRLGHSVLICGEEGLGQVAVAHASAQVLLSASQDQDAGESIELSPAVKSHPDVHYVTFTANAAGDKVRSEIVIEQIRQLREQLNLTAHTRQTRIAIIYPAEAMNHAATNALLKTLEEPAAHCYLWLISSYPMRLAATVRSRCQRLTVKMPSREEACQWLHRQGYSREQAAAALEVTRGHPTLALDWLSRDPNQAENVIREELQQLTTGKLAAFELAQRWTCDDQCAMRLILAAGHALQLASTHWENSHYVAQLADWFVAANETRARLATPLRSDLAMTELLLAWKNKCCAEAHA